MKGNRGNKSRGGARTYATEDENEAKRRGHENAKNTCARFASPHRASRRCLLFAAHKEKAGYQQTQEEQPPQTNQAETRTND